MAQHADHGLDRRRLAAEADVDEAPHRFDIVQHHRQFWIGQIVPVAEPIHAQHALEAERGLPRSPVG